MQYLLLVYVDESMIEALPEGEYDRRMRHCLERADALQAEGALLGFQQLERPDTARSVRRREGRVSVVDGPFAETKEMLAGFNLVEADSLDDAVRMAQELPWAETGCIEVRAVRDVDAVRARVGARKRPAVA
ncbi:YciI family protein [Luteimonas composti]|uniref:YciI family protein n=1 Tax=Luteimonas composti TaxID=398257 RepID=A0ABT6MP88_9GAMM|nr:YciI family protein [Luteimonas composti]MDH7452259.1 YciI family protein [Luteimonas composti]